MFSIEKTEDCANLNCYYLRGKIIENTFLMSWHNYVLFPEKKDTSNNR